MSKSGIVAILALLSLLAAFTRAEPAPTSASAPPAVGATTVAGEFIAGMLAGIDGDQAVFAVPGGQRKLPLRDLWQVRFGERSDLTGKNGQKMLALVGQALGAPYGGGMLAVKELSLAGGKLEVVNPAFGQLSLDLTSVSEIILPREDQSPAACRAKLAEVVPPAGNRDFLVAEDAKGNWVPATGALKSIEAGKVVFEFNGQDRTVGLSTVRGIRLAGVVAKSDKAVGVMVARDGSTVPFEAIAMKGGALELSGAAIPGGLSAQLSAVAQIDFRSDRCTWLSDLTPNKASQSGLFDVSFPHRKDRCVSGGPLRLGGNTFARGLGMHSRCELTWQLDGAYQALACTTGIDDSAGRRGNASLAITGDGKPLFGPTKLTGGSSPVPVKVDLAGVKQLTILVDFGEDNLDVGDLVDLADARLIKP